MLAGLEAWGRWGVGRGIVRRAFGVPLGVAFASNSVVIT
jgi:hypothetical protein